MAVDFRGHPMFQQTGFNAPRSHLSETCAVGTADESLTAPMLQFIQAPPR